MISVWRRWPKWWRKSLVLSFITLGISLGLLWRCAHPHPDYLRRVDRPMTVAEAKRLEELASFPFPPSAHDIYYAAWADWQEAQTMLRFDASLEDCLATIQQAIRWQQTHLGQKNFSTYPTRPMTSQIYLPAADQQFLSHVPWWDGTRITHGFSAGAETGDGEPINGGEPNVWVDSDLGRVYYYDWN